VASFKGQSHDFLALVFFIEYLPLGHCFTPYSVSAHNFEFAELEVDFAVSHCTAESKKILWQTQFFMLTP
jgi:hypothetical protein